MTSVHQDDRFLNPNLTKFLGTLENVRQTSEHQWEACCPTHDDNCASLSIGFQSNCILLKCQAGCDTKGVVESVGMTWKDLFPPKPNGEARNGRGGILVAAYDYQDSDGMLLSQVVRFDKPKDFRQRRPKEGGGWHWSVKGCKVVPYRLPELSKAKPEETVYIVEGEKDVNRLRSLELVATCNAGGAGKWKAVHSKYLEGRPVAIFQDNDTAGRKHAQQVAKSLDGKASSIKVVELPDLPEKGDVSDWLDAGGTVEQLLAIVEATPEWQPQADSSEAESPDDELGFVKIIADYICEEKHFAQDLGGKLFCFSRGAYRAKAEAFIKAKVKKLCVSLGATKKWSSRFACEVVEFIRVDSPELWDRPPIDIVNVENGLLRLSDGVLLPHSEKHLSPIQLPVKYDPKAVCPAYDSFVSEVFPVDAIDLAYEIPAWLMTPNTSIQKAILLLGAGGNGKSTWLACVQAFLGSVNVSALSLHRLESNRFSSARLLGKLANICADLPTEHLEGTSTFKAITGGDPIEGEHKHCNSFMFSPFSRLVFSANSPPRSHDGSEGFFDRWQVVPFDASFRGTKKEVSRAELDSRLSDPAELSGCLNKAVVACRRIRERGGLSQPESVRKAWLEFHAATDPLSVWLDQKTISDPDAVVAKQVLRSAYGASCEKTGRPVPTDNAFSRALRKALPDVSTAQRTINGRVQWCFLGIAMRPVGSHHSQHSQQIPTSVQPSYRTREDSPKGVEKGSVEQGREKPVNAVKGVKQEVAPIPHPEGPDREVLSL